jgi:NADH:ubiquinone oxidoreductase subunit D
VNYDIRKAEPYAAYDKVEWEVPLGKHGDTYDRYWVRMQELRQSARIIRQCLDKLPQGPILAENAGVVLPPKEKVMRDMESLIHHFIIVTHGVRVPKGEVYVGTEVPKGELGFYICSKGGGVPYRLKIRAPSFVNLSILPKILPGHMISDVVTILGSLDFVMGECDR